EVKENSPMGTFIANLTILGDPVTQSVRVCLSGNAANWLYLEGKAIRLNVSTGRQLDREAMESPVLLATLTCTEEASIPVQYKVVIAVVDENDNRPQFHGDLIPVQNISELTAVNTIVFTIQAEERDGDILFYSIDSTRVSVHGNGLCTAWSESRLTVKFCLLQANAKYFRIDLPNSGQIVLAEPLDYETNPELELVIFAEEMYTKERFNTSVMVKIRVLDGDDQYPQFLPCSFL
uniref:Cadherin domain-containing protein n=1 Tax=Latimeria chalumnae TaxID=7897 RepID=H2ZZ16_LATCH